MLVTDRRYYANSIGYPSESVSSSSVAVRAGVSLLGRWLPPRSDITRRSLRSADVPTCVVTRTFSSYGDRTYASAGPRLWNSLPVQLRNPHIIYGLFRRQLKEHLFGKHEHGALWLLICGALEKHLLTYLLTFSFSRTMSRTLTDTDQNDHQEDCRRRN